MGKMRWVWIVAALCMALLAGGSLYFWRQHKSPAHHCEFTDTLRQQSYPQHLYCPNITHLPAGIISNTLEATYSQGATVYSIADGPTTIAVTLQEKPAKDKLANFVPNVIPLHFDVETPVGKAQTGVAQQRSITSLPTYSNTWILLTAPKDYSPDRLTAILNSFQSD